MPKPVYVEVRPKRNEDFEKTVRRFIKKVKKEGIIDKILQGRFYEKPSEKRHRKKISKKRKIENEKRKNKSNYK